MSAIVFSLWLLTTVSVTTTMVQSECLSKNFINATEFSENLFQCAFPTYVLNEDCVGQCSFMTIVQGKACPWNRDFSVNPEGLKKALHVINTCLKLSDSICGKRRHLPVMGLQQDLTDFSYQCQSIAYNVNGWTLAGKVVGRDKAKERYTAFNSSHITIAMGLEVVHNTVIVSAPIKCLFTDKNGQTDEAQLGAFYDAKYEATAVIAYKKPTPTATVTLAKKTHNRFRLLPTNLIFYRLKYIPGKEKHRKGLIASATAIAATATDADAYAKYVSTYVALGLKAMQKKWCPK